jgi:hypothetical protein
MVVCSKSVFVTLCDRGYFPRALTTIEDLRTRGRWYGDIVLICVDFEPDLGPVTEFSIAVRRVTHIDTDGLVAQLRAKPIRSQADGRHFGKLHQWDKLGVFDAYFRRWGRVVFLDAGLRCFDSVGALLDLPYEGRLLAPDDSDPYDNGNRFRVQLDLEANPAAAGAVLADFSPAILDARYFLNCIFVYDTALLSQVSLTELEAAMNKYPICMCNEMGIMNLFFSFKLGVWTAFPQRVGAKYLFGWSELNYRERPTWRNFCFLKYPSTAP